MNQFGGCIASKAASKIYSYLTTEHLWQAPPPEFQVWSGVRERSFALDPALSFLKRPSGKDFRAALWPFDFMLQVAFTSPPLDAQNEEEAEAFTDEEPWEFPSLAPVISAKVAQGIAADPEFHSIHETMRDFTVLQRFFRVALAGGLGAQFPQEKFVHLMDATAAGAPKPSRTLRWNPRPGLLELVLAQRLKAAEAALGVLVTGEEAPHAEGYQQALRAMRSCRELIEATEDVAYIPQERWVARCSFESLGARAAREGGSSQAARLVQNVASSVSFTTRARNIRRNLGIHRDDHQASAQLPCPPM